MTEEARQRIEQLGKDRHRTLLFQSLLVFTSMTTLLLAVVLWYTLSRNDEAVSVYVQEAQRTVKTACEAAEGQQLPTDVQASCNAAKRDELPKVISSIVAGPAGATGATGSSGERGPKGDKGDKGDTGPTGPTGPIGPTGAAGANGADGAPGADGSQGAQGEVGPQGPQGPQGAQGAPGPSCAEGYTLKTFHYYGQDGIDNTGDEQDWLICVKD
jgi:hypothetical protein